MARVLCPGEHTTATLLYRLFHSGEGALEQVVFSEIMPALETGAADFGVCIHEGRFTWREHGLALVEDLGTVWERETSAPLPLGGILARHRLGADLIGTVIDVLRDSLAYALAHRDDTIPTMRRHAQELTNGVLFKHVDLYVNAWTTDLGDSGRLALQMLSRQAERVGVLPPGGPTHEGVLERKKEDDMLDIRRGMVIGSLAAICALGLACGSAPEEAEAPATAAEAAPAAAPSPIAAGALPPTEETAPDALNTSPRHGEWVDVVLPGSDVPISTWVVYPERSDSAPVVLVIHEIYGLTDWIRGVADQFAAEGFIAVAPDLLSGMGPDGGGTASLGERDKRHRDHPYARAGRADPAAERRPDLRARSPGRQRSARLGRVLLGWWRELRLRVGPARAARGRGVLRYVARRGRGLRPGQRSGARALRRGRRAGQLDHSAGRDGDGRRRQVLRADHLRRRGPRLPACPGGP